MIKKNKSLTPTLILGACFTFTALAQQPGDKDAQTRGTAWVANGGDANNAGGSLNLIDIEKLKIIATLPVGGYPTDILFTQGRDCAYVSNFASDTVWLIDTRSLQIVTTITVVPNPGGLALTPDGEFLYVASLASGAVSVIKTRTNSVIATIAVPTQEILSLAMTPNGRFLYATDCCTDTNVTVIDTNTNQVVTQIPLAGVPSGVAITPNGRYAFVENSADVSVIDTRTNTVVDEIASVQNACGPIVAISPNGERAYVEDYCSNSVYVVDTHTRSVVTTLSLNTPIGAAFSHDGNILFVTSNNCAQFPCTAPGIVSAVSTEDNTVLNSVTLGFNAQNLAVSPNSREPWNDAEVFGRFVPGEVGYRTIPRRGIHCIKCQ